MAEFFPLEELIRDRAEILLWMELFRWDLSVIDSIMYDDNPSTDDVRRLVYRHGPDRAYEILKGFVYDRPEEIRTDPEESSRFPLRSGESTGGSGSADEDIERAIRLRLNRGGEETARKFEGGGETDRDLLQCGIGCVRAKVGRSSKVRNLKPLVIYHAGCWDGFCAAWLLRKVYPNSEFFAAHYATDPPELEGRDVLIVDFSYPRETMREIIRKANTVTVLDHHKSAQAELEGLSDEFDNDPNYGGNVPVIEFDMSMSGGRMVFEHFKKELGSINPWLVFYTEDRDLWKWELESSREVNAGLRSYPLDFDVWDQLEKEPLILSRLMYEGSAILRRERQIVETHVRNSSEVSVAGYKILGVNATTLFSEIAGELAKDQPFGAAYFVRKDGLVQWSLRSNEAGLDVSEIAKQYGGGGHHHAAGFEVTMHQFKEMVGVQ